MIWSNCNSQEPHMVFFGRWCPLHKGHTAIIEKKLKENPNTPILIMIRDTSFDKYSAYFRLDLIKTWMKAKNIKGTAMIVPDIKGLYWGRGVGYEIEEVEVSDNIKGISATKIRELIKQKDESWKDLIACPEVAILLEEKLKE